MQNLLRRSCNVKGVKTKGRHEWLVKPVGGAFPHLFYIKNVKKKEISENKSSTQEPSGPVFLVKVLCCLEVLFHKDRRLGLSMLEPNKDFPVLKYVNNIFVSLIKISY